MRTGRTLQDFAGELQRQFQTKRDYLAPTKAIDMVVAATEDPSAQLDRIVSETEARVGNGVTAADVRLRLGDIGDFGLLNLGHRQLAEWCGIPHTYYERLRTVAPELLRENVSHWLRQSSDTRMLRTLDGKVRAFLSNSYRPLDNYDLFLAVGNTLVQAGARLVSQELTESRMYVKAVTDRITFQIKPGDVVQAGVVVQNSEVGLGQVQVLPLTLRLVCMNGMIHEDFGIKRRHIGKRQVGSNGDSIPEEWLRDETREADDKAFFMKVQDVVRGTFDEAKFATVAQRIQEARDRRIEADPVKVVEVFRKVNGLAEAEGGALLRHLIEGGDMSQWGLGNAVTRLSQDITDYDRATEFERLGGIVVEMPQADWSGLLKQAA